MLFEGNLSLEHDTASASVVRYRYGRPGEILSLGVKAGVDLQTLASAIGASTGTCRAIVDTFPKQLFRRHFEDPGFSSYLSAKDTHLAIELAHVLGVPMHIG